MKAENPLEKAASLPMPENPKKAARPKSFRQYSPSASVHSVLQDIFDEQDRQAVVLDQLRTIEKDRLDQHRREQEHQQALFSQQAQMLPGRIIRQSPLSSTLNGPPGALFGTSIVPNPDSQQTSSLVEYWPNGDRRLDGNIHQDGSTHITYANSSSTNASDFPDLV